jgi:hypothetical protein
MASENGTLMAVLGSVARLRGIPWDNASPLSSLLPRALVTTTSARDRPPQFLCDELSHADVFIADALRLLWPRAPELIFARVAALIFAQSRSQGENATLLVQALALAGVGEALRAGIGTNVETDSTLAIVAADCALAEWIAVTARLGGGLAEAFVTAELAAASERLVLETTQEAVVTRAQLLTLAGPLTHAAGFLLRPKDRFCAESVAVLAVVYRIRSLGLHVLGGADHSAELGPVRGLRGCLAGHALHSQQEVPDGDSSPHIA